jgi:cytochrome c oxidase subunit III
MEVGTAEIIDDDVSKKRRPSSLSGGPPNGNGGGGDGYNPGGDGGGGDRPEDDDRTTGGADVFVPGKSRILTGFLLLIVLMTFGGLMAAYVVIATNDVAEWHPFDLPFPVWISTGLILLSSLTYHLGTLAVDRNDHTAAKKWFVLTTVLSASFISSQLLAWLALSAQGLYMRGNPYAGFFYILTIVHAVHVLGGIVALGSILLRTWHPTEYLPEILRRRTIAQVIGWYWHLIGALWLVLLFLLGYWK